MASASSKMNALSLIVPVFAPLAIGSAGYAAYQAKWGPMIRAFLTGPGRTSRVLLLLFVVFNWKNMPFAWTYRVFYTIFYHSWLRKSPVLGPKALFKPIITPSRTPLLEIDYNLHKSNSTYFADLDVSRTHLVSYLCRPSLVKLSKNSHFKVVCDPKTGAPIKGPMGIMLGAVQCNFKKEMSAYRGFEMWSRVLSWDRKWLYVVTHFMPKNAARPTEWLDPRFVKARKRGPQDAAGGWDKKIYATAVSKYVFKVGRFTVHPAIVLGEAGLLPDRPGGWTSGEEQLGDLTADISDVDLSGEDEWTWERVEAQRQKGMELAGQFHALEDLHGVFDGGKHGALGTFGP